MTLHVLIRFAIPPTSPNCKHSLRCLSQNRSVVYQNSTHHYPLYELTSGHTGQLTQFGTNAKQSVHHCELNVKKSCIKYLLQILIFRVVPSGTYQTEGNGCLLSDLPQR